MGCCLSVVSQILFPSLMSHVSASCTNALNHVFLVENTCQRPLWFTACRRQQQKVSPERVISQLIQWDGRRRLGPLRFYWSCRVCVMSCGEHAQSEGLDSCSTVSVECTAEEVKYDGANVLAAFEVAVCLDTTPGLHILERCSTSNKPQASNRGGSRLDSRPPWFPHRESIKVVSNQSGLCVWSSGEGVHSSLLV